MTTATAAVREPDAAAVPSPMRANYAFIIGHYKSGSTWLANLLALHPDIRCLGETNVFRYAATQDIATATRNLFASSYWSGGGLGNLPRHRLAAAAAAVQRLWRNAPASTARPSTLLDLGVLDQFALKRELLACTSGEDYCRRFFEFVGGRLKPKAYLVEKTPNHILVTPFIRSVFPQARLIAVYRDGRDVVVSDRFFSARRGRAWNFAASVEYWRRLIEAQRAYAAQYDVFTCSYESLLEDGAATVAGLLRFLGLPADEHVSAMLRYSSISFMTGRRPGDEDRGSFYRKGVRGDWRNHFTDEDKRQFKEIAGDLLIELGYEHDGDW